MKQNFRYFLITNVESCSEVSWNQHQLLPNRNYANNNWGMSKGTRKTLLCFQHNCTSSKRGSHVCLAIVVGPWTEQPRWLSGLHFSVAQVSPRSFFSYLLLFSTFQQFLPFWGFATTTTFQINQGNSSPSNWVLTFIHSITFHLTVQKTFNPLTILPSCSC